MRWLRRGSNSIKTPPQPPAPAPWSLDGVPRPWTGEPILAFVLAGLDANGRLRDDHATLPDEPPDTGQLRWAPGALDGVVTSHTRNADDSPADSVIAAIGALAERCDAATLTATVATLRATEILPVIDTVLRGLADAADLERGTRIRQIGRLLAYEAPERALVKVGIGLVGVFGELAEDRGSLAALGAHEEFTLFVAVALGNLDAGERALWDLAKRVDGWGRIQLVWRLAGTQDPEIRAWMLRDGFRNTVMAEYLAYTCAVSGGLVEALGPDDIDAGLFDGASDILAALARGGPAEDLQSYEDREAAVARWLDHVEARGPNLRAVAAMDDLSAATLTPDLAARLDGVRRAEAADEVVGAGLQSDDAQTFAMSVAAAHVRGIDTTARVMERAATGDRYATFDLFRTLDEAHLDRALEIMRGRLDLDALGSGPGTELGLGLEFQDHFDLETVVNALARFPGHGTDFVLACLRSPVIRGRHAAIRTIRAWGPAYETSELRSALVAARAVEPNDGVRDAIDAALTGEGDA